MTPKPKVICIHGYTSNSQIHRLQMTPIVQALPEYDFIFPNAPHLVTIESQPIDPNLGMTRLWQEKVQELSDPGHLAWWYAKDGEWINPETGNFFGLEESIATIGKCIEGNRDAPIVIMGISQGACYAAMLCALFEEKQMDHELRKYLPSDLPPAAGVIFGGFRAQPQRHDCLYDRGIEAPVLHVTGDHDKLISHERREALIQACRFPTVLRFDGAHEVPLLEKERAKIVAFLQANLVQKGTA